LGSEKVAHSTLAFHFEKPEGFAFTPGESIDIFLPEDFPGASDDRQRTFSLASAPHEDRLTITTRMRKSAYKEPLAAAQPGAPVRIVGPKGTMSLHDDPDRAIVMIAGGIGITPFISMLRSEAQAERPRPMALLYSNHRPENAAYLHELRELEQRLGGFRLVLTMTGMKDSEGWRGETRRIDADMVSEAIAILINRPDGSGRGQKLAAGVTRIFRQCLGARPEANSTCSGILLRLSL
jgi:ferredoxin-NADP reductase